MADTTLAYIPGLHFFCDHRCWRCPLSARCLVPVRIAERPAVRRGRYGSSAPAARVAEVVMASLSVTIEQVGLVAAATPPLPDGDAASVSIPMVDPDVAAKSAEADPLTMRAREYATGSLRVLQALRPRLMRREDAPSLDAADRIEETCITVASKIHRAISSALSSGDSGRDIQSDANGSAKVALLVIEESRQGWRVLMRPGHAAGNGTPAGFIHTLDALESGLNARFPRALEFVRPGFDTADGGIESAWTLALRQAPGTRH